MACDDYCTPQWLVDKIEKVLDGIDLDPCSNEYSVVSAKLKYDIRNKFDKVIIKPGLSVFMNPPYSKGKIDFFVNWFVAYLFRSMTYGHLASVVLTNSSTETRWYQNLLRFCNLICLPNKRINFYLNGKEVRGNRCGQTIFFFDDSELSRTSVFIEEFKNVGTILKKEIV